MAENVLSSPLFAGRYKFQTVGNDWDIGRSGFTHLVFDMKTERLGVIKRAEINSAKAVGGLKNEISALLDLKGQNVPEVYDTGEAEHGSKTYFYLVMEYIEGIRIEKNLDSLTAVERAEILTQFFSLLAKAHKLGIVNGDVDLKHLFWQREKKQLVLIDWGNAKLDMDPKSKTEFAYDLARSAEIIYSLVTRKGHPPIAGSLALPANSYLFPAFTAVPDEFRTLCKWAPRTPIDKTSSPYTAKELWEVSKKWQDELLDKQAKRPQFGLMFLLFLLIAFGMFIFKNPQWLGSFFTMISTSTITSTAISSTIGPTESQAPTLTKAVTATYTVTQAPALTLSPTLTPQPILTPKPRLYSESNSILILDKTYSLPNCWENITDSPSGLQANDGLTRRGDGNWRFGTSANLPLDKSIQVDFQNCNSSKKINALALNLWVEQLEIENMQLSQDEKLVPQIGFFIEDVKGKRREYTLWVDDLGALHLRVRENSEIVSDDIKTVVNNLDITRSFPRSYAKFSIRIFLEIDNNELDIVYIEGGSLTQSPGSISDIVPRESIRVDSVVRPTMNDIQKIGLIGYSGATQTIVWPLVIFGEQR